MVDQPAPPFAPPPIAPVVAVAPVTVAPVAPPVVVPAPQAPVAPSPPSAGSEAPAAAPVVPSVGAAAPVASVAPAAPVAPPFVPPPAPVAPVAMTAAVQRGILLGALHHVVSDVEAFGQMLDEHARAAITAGEQDVHAALSRLSTLFGEFRNGVLTAGTTLPAKLQTEAAGLVAKAKA